MLPLAASLASEPSGIPEHRLPFVFNTGQAHPDVHFEARSPLGTFYFTASEVVLVTAQRAPGEESQQRELGAWTLTTLRLRFASANPRPVIDAEVPLSGSIHSLRGGDRDRWRRELPAYGTLVYRELYPGIDLRFDGSLRRLKGTYFVAPGADPRRIRWRYDGASSVRLDVDGSLVVDLPAQASRDAGGALPRLVESAPVAWQERSGQRVPIDAKFELSADGWVGFAVGPYDTDQRLTLDPDLDYVSYLGGSLADQAAGVAVDASGHVYVVGTALSADFPEQGGVQAREPGADVFVVKLDPGASAAEQLIYATWIGGAGDDFGADIAVDSSGRAFVTGSTSMKPVTCEDDCSAFPEKSAAQSCAFDASSDDKERAFLAVLDASGSDLVYSTCLGGSSSDQGLAVAVDSDGNAYVAGRTLSDDFVTTPGALPLQEHDPDPTGSDGFVLVIDPRRSGESSLVYSSYLGGSDFDVAKGIAVDAAGSIYVCGDTSSADYPTTPGAFDETFGGGKDAFVTKLGPGGVGLVFSTLLGGSDGIERGAAFAIGPGIDPDVYVAGHTNSADYPTTPPRRPEDALPDRTLAGGSEDAFVLRLRGDGSELVWSTFLGGAGYEEALGLDVDAAGNAIVVGSTDSAEPDGFPVTQSLHAGAGAGPHNRAAFVSMIQADGSAFVYSAVLGGNRDDIALGVALGSGSSALIVGETLSVEGFPTTNPLQDFAGQSDGFIARLTAPDLLPRFHRGDANANGVANLSDAIFIFLFLFIGGETPSCLEAADTDNSGVLNLTDGIFLLQFLFLGGPELPSPGIESSPCGTDPDPSDSARALGCDAYPPCLV